jgi:hypothetical protein
MVKKGFISWGVVNNLGVSSSLGDGKRFRGSFNCQVGGWYLNSLGVSLNWRMVESFIKLGHGK